MKKLILMLVVAAFAVLPGKSYALLGLVSVEGAVGGWSAAPSGDFEFQGSDDFGTDIEDTFGFDRETIPFARVRVEFPLIIPNVYLMATPMKFDGTAETGFTFAGKEFTTGADTELRLDQYDIGLFYGVPLLGLATLDRVNVDFGLNLRIVELEATMKGTINGIDVTETETATVPIPLLFAAAQIKLIGPFSVEAELRGISLGYAEILSAIGRFKYHAPGPFFIAAGYRSERIVVDTDDFDVDVEFKGIFGEAGFSF